MRQFLFLGVILLALYLSDLTSFNQVARILLFIYVFYHIYLHYSQVITYPLLMHLWTLYSILLCLYVQIHIISMLSNTFLLFYLLMQVMQMHAFGYYLTFIVPSVLFVMNTMWFMKILKGVKKTLGKWS